MQSIEVEIQKKMHRPIREPDLFLSVDRLEHINGVIEKDGEGIAH